ncbi:beta-trefoil DNA-binding domain-containing protein [Mortierella sp. GBAus27b]|nr:beta-trefoil DNA-binding domain-containing protein [Mortierella sp. GBAus27b]
MLNPPKMIVSISGEAGGQQGVVDWTSSKDDATAPVITGKCVSKQLFINDADEKRKKVEVLVKFMMAGDVELGTFASKPIKVISKPSKKRQSIKNMELCIHHGTTISLFNRIRSQTVSTNLEPLPESSTNPVNVDGGTCFVARTGSWDPFVVWIVSPGQTRTESLQEHAQRHPGFPPPPAIAINSPPENGAQIPIHYNQPIVLQCLSTGLVSPVMVIRKVDKGSMVIGGGSTGNTSGEYEQEALGDPVSQLHKVAFQITGQATPAGAFSHSKLQQGTYLACLSDVVGMQLTKSRRRVQSMSVTHTEAQRIRASALAANHQHQNSPVQGLGNSGASAGSEAREKPSKDGAKALAAQQQRRHSSMWTEDVTDAAVWTIVGTDCAQYNFCVSGNCESAVSNSSNIHHDGMFGAAATARMMTLKGSGFTRDLSIWFGTIKAPATEYRSPEMVVVHIPEEVSLGSSFYFTKDDDEDRVKSLFESDCVPILLVRTDGVIYRSGHSIALG